MSRSVRGPDYRRMSAGGVIEGHIPEELMVRYNDNGRREYWDQGLRRWVVILTAEEVAARYNPQFIQQNEGHNDV